MAEPTKQQKLTPEQVAALEETLKNFVSQVKSTGKIPLPQLMAGHSSHYME